VASQQPPRAPIREVFVVRLWRETQNSPIWLGQVQHVRTGQTVYVRGAKELLDYIQSQMDNADSAPKAKRGLK
jgi:hypothetical protein